MSKGEVKMMVINDGYSELETEILGIIYDLVSTKGIGVKIKGGLSVELDFVEGEREYLFELDDRLLLRFLGDMIADRHKKEMVELTNLTNETVDKAELDRFQFQVEVVESSGKFFLHVMGASHDARVIFNRDEDVTLEVKSLATDGQPYGNETIKLKTPIRDGVDGHFVQPDMFDIRQAFKGDSPEQLSFFFRKEDGYFELTLEAKDSNSDIILEILENGERVIASGFVSRENYGRISRYYYTL